jgi:hypothetical protein
MKTFGLGSLHDVFGDAVTYRSLSPIDRKLPGFHDVARELGLGGQPPPRKSEPAYGTVVARLVRETRASATPGKPIRRIVYLGDTRMNDGNAFQSICRAGEWPGMAFIGSENGDVRKVSIERTETSGIALSNRWSALRSFETIAKDAGILVDESTAVLIDLDKTALGARGRNDAVIDQARLAAARSTVASILGPSFNAQCFERAYARLNQPDCHGFTGDNQDVVVYVCLIVGTGVFELESLVTRIRQGELRRFDGLVRDVEAVLGRLPNAARALHQEFRDLIDQGDVTPFKAFRRAEYRETVARMGVLPDTTGTEQRLRQEITLTAEVRETALRWRSRGALILGLSDKPEEACLPDEFQRELGFHPLHRAVTHIVGTEA